MEVAGEHLRTKKFSSVIVVFVMLLSSMVGVMSVDNVAASTSGNLSIAGTNPSEFSYIPAYEPTFFEVEVTNLDSNPSEPRTISWYVCIGEEVTNICISQSIDDGDIDIPVMGIGETNHFASQSGFYPNGINQTITVVYQFDEFDFNPSNDVINFKLNSTLEYTDFRIETNDNIISSVSNLANYNGVDLLSNNTAYNFTFSGFANLCASCNLNATLGWQLWNSNQSEMITELYEFTENFPKFSFYKSFDMTLPTFQHDTDGEYVLLYGIFNSTGNPFNDLNPSNNVNSITVIIDTELDLSIDNLYPSHNPSEQDYLYGQDMVSVMISNNGNTTATNFNLDLLLTDDGVNYISQSCQIASLAPNQQRTCVFDMPIHGNSIEIQAVLPTFINNNFDSNELDNVIEEIADVVVAQLASSISISEEKEWYTDNEIITVSAEINPFSASPVNFSWWYSGIVNIDFGQQIDINTADYGLGSHTFKLVTSDSLGNSEIIYFSILVFSEISIQNYPFYEASATSPSNTVEIEHAFTLPTIGENYNIGGNRIPLMLYQFDLIDTINDQSIFDGQNWLDVELNLYESLPNTVDFSTIDLRKLDSVNDLDWEYFNAENYGYQNQTSMYARLYEPTTILVIGEIGEPVIEAVNFSVELISSGNFELNWEPYGDTDSDYILGWNIHQRIVPEFGGTIFQSPQQDYNELVWEDLVLDSFRTFVPLSETSWQDLLTVPDGFCSSYAIIPVDRTGQTYNHLANVSMDNGTATFVCGDSNPPSTSIINMQNSWRFTNDTACYDILKDWNLCYEVTISWIWPEGEVDETWNLYRVEQNPNGMDLALLQPILSGISYVAGESFQFTQNGIDDDTIRPMKTYYYILTPTDQYGNERTVAIYPSANVERVHIENDWWAYNQHVIPEPEPEPEPPLNSEWLGNFSDSLDQQEFQTAGIVTLVTLCLGVIMLAFISKRLKRLKRVIGARNRRLAANSMADEFDEFFE